MAVPVSSLSVAVQGIADFLDGQFGEDVVISTDTPQRASERVKGGDKHLLNLFTYRVLPSGFQAAVADDEPYFVRINTLLTPFLTDQGNPALDADLRILGHALRVLHSRPIIPSILPGNNTDPTDFRSGPHIDYRLQAVLQAPSMEELNHIWTTQGGELAYRLSVAYEFALIPIEPLEHGIEAGPVTTGILDIRPNVDAGDTMGFIEYGDEVHTIPLGARGSGGPSPATDWLPVVLFANGGMLTNTRTVTNGTPNVNVAIAGPPEERVALEVSWVRADSSEVTQSPQVFTILSHKIDDPTAIVTLTLNQAATGDSATILTRPVDGADQPIATSPFANTLSLTVGA
ncbi:MAG: hypothetical protein NPIRA02_09750 [Nitrospirales bacterium]|nr:MAG: hypothetical protein NPIRA02_09750 [Nitrospirales bacterium]